MWQCDKYIWSNGWFSWRYLNAWLLTWFTFNTSILFFSFSVVITQFLYLRFFFPFHRFMSPSSLSYWEFQHVTSNLIPINWLNERSHAKWKELDFNLWIWNKYICYKNKTKWNQFDTILTTKKNDCFMKISSHYYLVQRAKQM